MALNEGERNPVGSLESDMPENGGQERAADNARQRRAEAIRAMAGASAPEAEAEAAAPTRPMRPTGGKKRRGALLWGGVALVVVVGLIALVIGAVLHQNPATAPRVTAQSHTVIRFTEGSFSCPLSASWSPDGKTLAVTGYATCGDDPTSGAHPQVALIDAATGREEPSLLLESALVRDVTHGAPLDNYDLQLGAPVWTADSQSVGVLFSLSPQTPQGQAAYGLVILGVHGQFQAITLAPPPDKVGVAYETYNLYFVVPPLTVRFDTASHTAAVITPELAPSYTVDAAGALTPSIEAGAVPASLSGNVSYDCALGGDAAASGNSAYAWVSAGGPAWSPDGRYFFSTLGAYGQLAGAQLAPASHPASGAAQTCLNAGPAANWSNVTLPFTGLASAVSGLDPYVTSTLVFVTSPDGSRIAVSEYLPPPTSGAPGATNQIQMVTVYATGSGKRLAQFAVPQLLKQLRVANNPGGTLSMLWAPDGRSLALLDTADRALIILGPSQLG